jgi:hypothetical protein
MRNQPHLANNIDLDNLAADKPLEAATRAALTAREVLAGATPKPQPPDISGLPELFNRAVETVTAAEAALAGRDRAQLAADAARLQLEEALADHYPGKTESEALDAIRAARDAADLCDLGLRRAEGNVGAAEADRRTALEDLAQAANDAANTQTVLEALAVIERLESEIGPELRARRALEAESAIDYLARAGRRTAEIGGVAQTLHARARDVASTPNPSAIRYFLRDCRRVIEFFQSAKPPAEMPIDPILEPIHGDKPRRGFPKRRLA